VLHVHVPNDPETTSTYSSNSSITVQTPDRLVALFVVDKRAEQ